MSTQNSSDSQTPANSPESAQEAPSTATTQPDPAEPMPTTPGQDSGHETAVAEAGQETKRNGKQIGTLDDALKVISDLRAENARQRTTAKESAANEARTEIATVLAKALGMPGTEQEEATDPSETVAELTSQVQAQTEAAREAALELAVYKSATGVGADPTRLLDSRRFLQSVSTIDSTDTEAITSAIKKAVEANPDLRVAQAAGPYRTDHTPGGSGSANPLNLDDALTARYGR